MFPRTAVLTSALHPDRAALEADVLAGLWTDEPTLPPRWFYDETGSRLFEQITSLPEYYPTRREREILACRAGEIVGMGARVIIELGAGSANKTRLLLDALTDPRGVRYLPMDISAETLHETASALRGEYPGLQVEPVVADFHARMGPFPGGAGERLALFLGGTVGNFEETERAGFLNRLAEGLSVGDHFLLGLDLIKDERRLTAAYDDSEGVTAAFNRNVIERIRTTLGTVGLAAEDFAHVARWDAEQRRIEMRLRARRDIAAYFPTLGKTWHLPAGADLRTEVCRKFHPEEIAAHLAEAGLHVISQWTDEDGDYALVLSRRGP